MTRSRHGPTWKKTQPVALALAFLLYTIFSWNHFGLSGPGLAGSVAPSGQALAAPRPNGGGQAVVGRPVAGKRVQLPWSKALPTPSAQERQAMQAAQAAQRQLKMPVGPVHHMTAAEAAALRRTAGPPLPLPRPVAHAAAQPAPQADSTFDVELNTPISSGGICSACGLGLDPSPSVANDGKNLWMTGDFFTAQSTDNGTTWSALDPFATASSMGLAPFTGKQQVLYEPSRDTFFWSLSVYGGRGAPANGIGLVTQAGNLGGSACAYPLFSPAFGLPTGYWLMEPDIEYSANYLYLSFDFEDPTLTIGGSVVARLPLSPMVASMCGSVTPQVVSRSDNFHFTLAQGATDTMYWISNEYRSGPTNGNHVRIFFWPESSGSYTFNDESIDPFTFLDGSNSGKCGSQDGLVADWCIALGSWQATLYRSRAGYRGFGAPLLGMAWTAGATSGIGSGLFPYVVREYFYLATLTYKGHDNLYNNNAAVAWPSLAAPVQRGYVGGTFIYGGGTGTGGTAVDYYPDNGFLIEDPDTPTQPWATVLYTGSGNPGLLGSYQTARAWAPDGLHWIADYVDNVGGVLHPSVVIFGRGRDHNAYLRWANS